MCAPIARFAPLPSPTHVPFACFAQRVLTAIVCIGIIPMRDEEPAMTTTSIEQPGDSSIPRWFHEFALANAAQHAELADRIAHAEQHGIDRIAQAERHNIDRTAQAEQRSIDRIARVDEKVVDLEKRMLQMESRIIRWVVGSAVGVVGSFAAVVAAAAAAWAVWG